MALSGRQRLTDESLRLEARMAMRRGAAYLVANQLPDGSWANHAAITSLAALALMNLPVKTLGDIEPKIGQALDAIAQQAASSGAIGLNRSRDYPVFTTAVSLLALIRAERPEDETVLRHARRFLLEAQVLDVPETRADFGGFRAAAGQPADLTTTEFVMEALFLSDRGGPPRPANSRSPDTERVNAASITFLSRQQQAALPATAPALQRPAGWFVDRTAEPAGAPAGGTPRSIGFLTCAGLKSLLYARVAPEDPRIAAARAWLDTHYSAKENPGLGAAGYYTYLFSLTRALNALETLTPDRPGLPGHPDWRTDIVAAVVARQEADGSWKQRVPDWWENRPELVTAYALLTLELASRDNHER